MGNIFSGGMYFSFLQGFGTITRREGITRITRDFPPAHYLFKIESYSLLLKTIVEKYESGVFEAGGYKWRLIFYPNGDKDGTGNGYISLYLAIAETESLPLGWEVNVSFKLFVFDQRRDKYLTIQDVVAKRFYQMKTEWGFAQLLSLASFNDTSNGYIVGDSCVFGAEVFVIKPTAKLESLSMIKEPANCTMTWNIEKFSTLDKDYCYSKVFTVGELKWNLLVYPTGCATAKGEFFSAFLHLQTENLPPWQKVYAEYKLRVRSQINGNHVESTVRKWFCISSKSWGCSKFMSLKDLYDASKGFIVNDALIVEGEITIMSKVKCSA